MGERGSGGRTRDGYNTGHGSLWHWHSIHRRWLLQYSDEQLLLYLLLSALSRTSRQSSGARGREEDREESSEEGEAGDGYGGKSSSSSSMPSGDLVDSEVEQLSR